MNRVFYGVCKTTSGESEKRVVVPDTELLNQDFKFNRGDLLTVFFAHKNTADKPTLTIYVGDTEQEPSTTADVGKFVKTYDVEADAADAWGDGETVIFAYTQRGATNTFYWELIDAVHSSTSLYGVTKLFDDTNFNSWIGEPESDEDSKIALTPNTLKKFFNLLKNGEESEDLVIGLKWTPAPEIAQYETDNLGTLSLTGNDNGITITYPIQAIINNKMGGAGIPTYTGQLENNGNGPGTEDSNPFITKIVPDDLFFANGNGLKYQSGANSVPRIILNDENDRLALGDDDDDTLTGVYIAKPLVINGRTTINSGGINITGNSEIRGGLNVTGTGGAAVLYEGGTSLQNKYSKKLSVIKYTHVPLDSNNKKTAINPRNTCWHQHIDVSVPNKTPLCVVGYNVNYGNTNYQSDSMYANVWECYLRPDNTVEYAIYNATNTNRAIEVSIDIYVLYVNN